MAIGIITAIIGIIPALLFFTKFGLTFVFIKNLLDFSNPFFWIVLALVFLYIVKGLGRKQNVIVVGGR